MPLPDVVTSFYGPGLASKASGMSFHSSDIFVCAQNPSLPNGTKFWERNPVTKRLSSLVVMNLKQED